MKTIDFSYFIERYNAGEMSEAEIIWFRKELESNEKLRNEVNLRKKTDEVLKNQRIIMLRNKLSEIERIREESSPVKKTKKHVYVTYAAILAGLILIGGILFVPGKPISNDEIIDQYYKPYEPPTATRSAMSSTNAVFIEAVEYYNTHDYENAAIQFSKVLESDEHYWESVLMNGVSNFENKKYPEAENSFEKVISNDDNLCVEDAKYYLALCYLKTGEKEKAIKQLELIKSERGIHSSNAKKIIRNLK